MGRFVYNREWTPLCVHGRGGRRPECLGPRGAGARTHTKEMSLLWNADREQALCRWMAHCLGQNCYLLGACCMLKAT